MCPPAMAAPRVPGPALVWGADNATSGFLRCTLVKGTPQVPGSQAQPHGLLVVAYMVLFPLLVPHALHWVDMATVPNTSPSFP